MYHPVRDRARHQTGEHAQAAEAHHDGFAAQRRLRKYVEKVEVEREPSSIDASVREVLELMPHEFRVHGARIVVQVPPGLPGLMLDRVQIEQVLVNPLRNALEAMADAGAAEPVVELVLQPSEAPSGVTLSIRDNGVGFGATDPEQLFAPFFTTKKQGPGQGLSICRRIVDAHGGRLWAEPNQPRGAAFHFWLPVEDQGGRGGLGGRLRRAAWPRRLMQVNAPQGRQRSNTAGLSRHSGMYRCWIGSRGRKFPARVALGGGTKDCSDSYR